MGWVSSMSGRCGVCINSIIHLIIVIVDGLTIMIGLYRWLCWLGVGKFVFSSVVSVLPLPYDAFFISLATVHSIAFFMRFISWPLRFPICTYMRSIVSNIRLYHVYLCAG